jgi:hypothetical protein
MRARRPQRLLLFEERLLLERPVLLEPLALARLLPEDDLPAPLPLLRVPVERVLLPDDAVPRVELLLLRLGDDLPDEEEELRDAIA